MLIDWFTVFVQVFNFIFLIWLMKRFLYRPILNAIDEREKRIAAEIENAHKIEQEAQRERDEFNRKNDDFDKIRNQLLDQAVAEAAAEKARLRNEDLKDLASLKLKKQEKLKNEQASLREMLRERTQKEVFAISSRVLKDLAGADIQDSMLAAFLGRLQAMSPAQVRVLVGTGLSSLPSALVSSSIEISMTQRGAIEKALEDLLKIKVSVQFKTSKEIIAGIELLLNGQKISWSVAEYLVSLEERVDQLSVDRESKAEA
jgi:F-type H+-transporting ATPase subunit b